MCLIKSVLVLFVVVFCMLLNETYGAQAILKPVAKPPQFADQEGCYDPELNRVLNYGETAKGSHCSSRHCKENGDIIIASCGAIGVAEGMVLVKGNPDLPYPDCCDTVAPKPKDS